MLYALALAGLIALVQGVAWMRARMAWGSLLAPLGLALLAIALVCLLISCSRMPSSPW